MPVGAVVEPVAGCKLDVIVMPFNRLVTRSFFDILWPVSTIGRLSSQVELGVNRLPP